MGLESASVHPFIPPLFQTQISQTNKLIEIKFCLEYHWDGERLHKDLDQIGLYWMSSKFGRIRPQTVKLSALVHL